MSGRKDKPRAGEVIFRKPHDGGGVIPIKNGKSIGTVGAKIKADKQKPTALPEKYTKSASQYISEANGNTAQGCQNFYANELMGHYAKTEVSPGTKARVRFTTAGFDKIHDIVTRSPELADVVEYLPDIIKTGKRANDKPADSYHKDENGKITSRHTQYVYFTKKVKFSDGVERNVILDVGLTRGSYWEQYSFIAKGSKGYDYKKKELADKYNIIIEDAQASPINQQFSSRGVGTPPLSSKRCASVPFDEDFLAYDGQIVNIWIENIQIEDANPADLRNMMFAQDEKMQPVPFNGSFSGLNAIRLG